MPKILLVEDDNTMLSLLQTLLKMEGFATAALGDSEKVIEAVYREKPDVILLDVHLAQGSGIQLLREIRLDPKLDRTLVLMQSGLNLADECKAAGADEFLLKPYMPEILLNTIRQGLANREG